MKRIIINISIILTLISSWGCSDFLDINQDPNSLGDIPEAKVLLPVAQVSLGNTLMGWDYGFYTGLWVEYWTQAYTASQFKAACEYQPASFNTAYNNLTAGILKDLYTIIELEADKENKAFYYIAEALFIYTYQVVTDTWGNVPYFEALQGDKEIYHPKFDSGETIYEDLLKRVEALQAIDLSNSVILGNDKNYDFIFNGDLTKWELFVNSLKLKLMMRVSETSQYNNSTVLSYIEETEFLTTESAKISGSIWSDNEEGKRHPMREFQQGGAGYLSTNIIACKSFIDYLSVNSDPRVANLFTSVSGAYKGAFFGDFDSKADSDGNGTSDDKEAYSQVNFAADMDIMILSDWEVNFYIAEVYARASNPDKAKEYYDQGVKSSLTQHGISDFSIVENGYAKWVNNSSVEENIKQIAMQKWVSHAYYQHLESFLERNRTKYPAVNDIDIRLDRQDAYLNFPLGDLTISVNGRARTNGLLPASPIYPTSVLNRNNNAPAQKDNLLQKIWWDKKAGK